MLPAGHCLMRLTPRRERSSGDCGILDALCAHPRDDWRQTMTIGSVPFFGNGSWFHARQAVVASTPSRCGIACSSTGSPS